MKLLFFLCALLISSSVSAQEIPKSHAVIVIGGGPAGLSCATACAKTGYPTLVCDVPKEGLFYPDLPVTNWPGHASESWKKTIEDLKKEFIRQRGIFLSTHVKAITKNQGVFHVTTDMGIFHAPAIVIATGRHPPIVKYPVTSEQPTRILSHLYDDSFLSPFDTAVIIGSSEYALMTALQIAPRIKQVYLFLQPPWKPTSSPAERVAKRILNITWMTFSKISAITGLKSKVLVEYLKRGSKYLQEASWVIFADDWIPQSDLVRNLAERNSTGALVTYDATGITPTPGLFACGEVASRGFLPGISAAADGLITSSAVCQFLIERGPLPTPPVAPKEETPPPPPPGPTGPEGQKEQNQ